MALSKIIQIEVRPFFILIVLYVFLLFLSGSQCVLTDSAAQMRETVIQRGGRVKCEERREWGSLSQHCQKCVKSDFSTKSNFLLLPQINFSLDCWMQFIIYLMDYKWGNFLQIFFLFFATKSYLLPFVTKDFLVLSKPQNWFLSFSVVISQNLDMFPVTQVSVEKIKLLF